MAEKAPPPPYEPYEQDEKKLQNFLSDLASFHRSVLEYANFRKAYQITNGKARFQEPLTFTHDSRHDQSADRDAQQSPVLSEFHCHFVPPSMCSLQAALCTPATSTITKELVSNILRTL
jgi:hypothetical protein